MNRHADGTACDGFLPRISRILILSALLGLSACGGGGGGSSNRAPVASFTATPSAGQVPLTVAFDASASSDSDGSITSYSWNFGDNTAPGSGVTVNHLYQAAGTFTATLTVTDNRGKNATTTRVITVTVGPPPGGVTVSGRVLFERVPFLPLPQDGLNYPGTFAAPAREIEVELLQAATGAVLATAMTDTNGNYAFTAPPSTDVRVRAKALSRVSGTTTRPAAWDLRVLNNTNGNALYVLDSSVFSTGAADVTRNLTATTGWGGGFAGTYTGVRAAAPFAVLDTLYAATQFVIAQGDSALQLPPLKAFWSAQNRPSAGDPADGNIESTLYGSAGSVGSEVGIYILGAENNDTDEFDQHVLAHEYQHFLEDAISRTDSIGGPHSLGERLDMRVAFSEGFANAYSAMALDDPLYRDSFGTAQGSDFNFNIESDAFNAPGWYSEASIHRIVWDLFDAANDAADSDGVTIGYGPMFEVFRAELRSDVPLTSLFAFISALKQRPSMPVASINVRVEAEGVPGTSFGVDAQNIDAYATTETHSSVSPVSADLVLPIYSEIALN
ncbi:MAG: hypothetical protein QG586_150, partial [Pseudomonadota bacterium]|nr:hypothetical protein [Pseudomonadota bacterium]